MLERLGITRESFKSMLENYTKSSNNEVCVDENSNYLSFILRGATKLNEEHGDFVKSIINN